jgi:hypothetical protein
MISILRLRQWHAYIGLFIAPSVLFFAVTGTLQIFNLHEAHGSYRPAVLLEKLSAVHKDQVFEQPHAHDAPPADQPASAPPADDDDDKTSVSTMALKWLFTFMAVGLVCSSLIGIWMGTTQTRSKPLAWSLLAAGTLLPILLLVL